MEDLKEEVIVETICKNGFKAYFCGGAVRDMFLNKEPDDIDVVTNALPTDLTKIFSNEKVKTVGANFLVTLVNNIEVATYRSDENFGAGRHSCITSPCETLEEDLSRRDFTFNAMAICPYTGEVIDLFDGRKDLKNRIVKFIGDPNKRIYEDYLRMIRAARFACLIEGKLDKETDDAIYRNRHLVKQIAPERIHMELLKVMKYNDPGIFFDILYEIEILDIILPELDFLYGFDGGIYHNETIDVHSKLTCKHLSPRDPLLRLTGMLHDIGKPTAWLKNNDGTFVNHEKYGYEITNDICSRLKFSTEEIERVSGLVLHHMRAMKDLSPKGYRRLIKRLHEKNLSWKDLLKMRIADGKANLRERELSLTKEAIKKICISIYKATHESKSGGFKITDLEINGNEVMQILNIKPGPLVGQILNHLLEVVIDEPSLNEKQYLKEQVKIYGQSDEGQSSTI